MQDKERETKEKERLSVLWNFQAPGFLIMQSLKLQGLRQANIHATKNQAEYKDNSWQLCLN